MTVEASTLVSAEAPWPGLAPFTEDQSAFFHGREEEVRALARLMERKALTVLFGQSGLGKSSLLQAGVFPRLRAANFCPIYIRLDHADGAPNPTEQVKVIVASETVRVGAWTKPGVAKPGETLWEFFHHRDDRLVDARDRVVVPVLVFDQFEELFTLGGAAGAERDRAVAFMSELAELVENRPSEKLVERLEQSPDEMEAFDFGRTDYRVCISLREDYLPHLEGLKTIMPALMENRMRLTRMTGTQAIEAVLKPGGALVTPEVARTIVEFVSGARGGSVERLAEVDVEPPLLSVICRELNERRRALGHARITADLVTGNRREILTDFYERSVSDLPEPMRRFVEDKLLTKSGFRDNLALETALEEPGVTRPLIDALVARRLLRVEDRIGTQRVELTHDVLADVVRASRDARQQRLALEQVQARERAAAAEAERRTRRQRWIIAGLACAVVALAAATLIGLRQRQRAQAGASQTDAAFGSRLLEEGNAAEGIAYLVRAAREDRRNGALAPRLVSALVSRNFLMPLGAPLPLGSPIVSVNYALDGSRAWVLCGDGRVRVIDPLRQHVSAELPLGGGASGIEFPAGNDQLFVAQLRAGGYQAFESRTGRPLSPVMSAAGDHLLAWALSGDGRWCAMAGDNQAWVWETKTGKLRGSVGLPEQTTDSIDVSPDGERLLIGRLGGVVRQIRVRDGSHVGADFIPPVVSETLACRVKYSPDGRLFAAAWISDGAQLFDSSTGQPVGAHMAHDVIQFIEFAPDARRFLTHGADGGVASVHTWDAKTGAEVAPVLRIPGRIRSFSWDRDRSALVAIDRSGLARMWDARTGIELAQAVPGVGAARGAVGPRGSVLILSAGERLHFFRPGGGAARPLSLRRSRGSLPAAFLKGAPSRVLLPGSDRAVVLDVATGRELPGGFRFPVRILGIGAGSAVRSDGGAMVVAVPRGGNEAAVKEWQAWLLGPGGLVQTVPLAGAPLGPCWVRFSPAGDLVALVASSSRRTIAVWNLHTGRRVGPSMTFDAVIPWLNATPASFSADGRYLAAGAYDGSARMWEVETGRPLFELGPQGGRVSRIAFSPDGRWLAIGSVPATVRVWSLATARPVGEPVVVGGSITGLSFSADGTRLLTAMDGDVRIWNAQTLEPLFDPIPGVARSAEFNHDGSRFAIAGNDAEARVWDSQTGVPVTERLPHPEVRVAFADYGPDDRVLRTDTSDSEYHFWSIPPPLGGAAVPDWLLDLATLAIGQRLTESGKLVEASAVLARADAIRQSIAALPDNAPYAEWGRWFLDTSPTRSIAPGFSITPAEADALSHRMDQPGERAQAELKAIRANGGDFAYIEEGSGEPVVLVHGALGDYRDWQPQMAALAARYHVIAYSRRFHHPNAPAAADSSYTLAQNATDLCAFLTALHLPPAHLIGHSYGGAVVAIAAAAHPELVKTVTLVEPSAFSVLNGDARGRDLLARQNAAYVSVIGRLERGEKESVLRDFVDLVAGPGAYDSAPAAAQAEMLRNLPTLAPMLRGKNRGPAFPLADATKLTMPVLLIGSERSPAIFHFTEDKLQVALPNVRRVTLAGVSHFSPREAPAAFNAAVLNFLAE